ncbi:winged helix-turn-helix transcriptional regulator [Actinomadura rudentiformis]|uniref:Transcriptional regulator n=1 Tax=Actinomadura rudentiformis TaxID=359158 RepID=A0A6H9Z558_9ACTN|nr:winged helix-turn-helix transcriptional regulator [Actinomadura rudentiformis]KAB2350112.1 transcriptional regulator [Actinomadura rudentiformis]
MAGKRSYQDGCAAAHALQLVGDRWALLVVRELLLGPKRFTDLRNGLPGAAPNVISQRLRELEASGVVRRRTLGPPAASKVYELTDWGLELEPVVIALGRWGSRSPSMLHDAPLSVDALVLALRTLFSPAAARGLTGSIGLRFGLDEFAASVSDGQFHIERGDAAAADATIVGDSATVNEILWGERDLDDAVKEGALQVEGDTGLVRRFLELFPLPEPAALAD